MTTSYSPLLGMALPVTGELSGAWGDTVNNYITSYVDASVAGTQTISGSQTAVTLSVTTATSLTQAGTGATGSAQYQIINCTGNPASLLTITAPAASKTYLILNATSTSQSVKIVGAGPTTGVTLIAGEKAVVAWNGSDFVKVSTTATAAGSNTQVQYNSSGNLAGSSNLTFDGTYLTANSIKDSALTATRVTYAGASGLLQDSANLTFDGTSLTLGGNPTLSGGTANGVAYLNASKVLTSGSALTFDGTGQLVVNRTGGSAGLVLQSNDSSTSYVFFGDQTSASVGRIEYDHGTNTMPFYANGTEGMRLTSTGLGIGTTSPAYKLDVSGTAGISGNVTLSGGTANGVAYLNGSKVLTSGSALTYNGSTLQNTTSAGGISAVFTDATYSTLKISHADTTGNVALLNGANQNYAVFGSASIFYASATELMRLTSTGLGIGTSSPSARLTTRAIGNGYSNSAALSIQNYTGTNTTYLTNVGGALYLSIDGSTDNLVMSSSGNLGLGVTPSAWLSTSGYRALQIGGVGLYGRDAAANELYLYSNGYNSSTGNKYIYSAAATLYQQVAGVHSWHNAPSGTAGAAISFTQAMTLDASGNLLVGTTSNSPAGTQAQFVNQWSGGSKWGAAFDQTVSSATQYTHINFSTNGTTVGYINANNSVTTYNSVSDYRLKNVIGLLTGHGERLDALEPVEYEWKSSGERTRGFLAHKFQEVYPQSVSGTKDAVDENGNPVYQAMQASTSEVIADLVAEIQSLRKRLAAAGIA